MDFVADKTTGEAPLTVKFTSQRSDEIRRWSWDFGDGSGGSYRANPSHTFHYAGTFYVTLTISGSGWSRKTTACKIVVTEPVVTTTWVERFPTTKPETRCEHAMVYDAKRKRVVLFGGHSRHGNKHVVLGDTWEWDGQEWLEISPATSPAPRLGHTMVYDSKRCEVLLFGGANRWNTFNDVWAWNGQSWQVKSVYGNKPVKRYFHSMTYDSSRDRVVLFGGESVYFRLKDTWEWDGQQWTERKPATNPGIRVNSSLVYDAGRQKTVLYGGGNFYNYQADACAWEWNGEEWTKSKCESNPPLRWGQSMTYDTDRKRVVMFGGWNSTKPNDGEHHQDTWLFNGTSWQEITTVVAPIGRQFGALVFDQNNKQLFLFGGCQVDHNRWEKAWLQDTWVTSEENRVKGSVVSFGVGCGTSQPLTLLPGSEMVPTIGQEFALTTDNLPVAATLGLLCIGTNKTAYGSMPLPFDLTLLGMTGCNLYCNLVLTMPLSLNNSNPSTLQIPDEPALVRACFYLQALAAVPGANPLGVMSSNGLEARVGN